MSAPSENFAFLLAEWVLDELPPEAVPRLATTALEQGCASAVVAVLAGLLRPTRTDIEAELPDLLRDLGVPRPSELQALKTLTDDRLARIAARTDDPVTGAERISRLWRRFDADRHPETWIDVSPFIALAGAPAPVSPAGASTAIVEAARSLLDRGGLNIGARLTTGQLDGRVLSACTVQEHVLDGARTVIRLGLGFADGLFITLGAAPQGRAVQLGSRTLKAHDLGEHGHIEVRDEGFPCDVLTPGLAVQTVTTLVDRGELPIGARIDIDGASVYVYRQEDNLAIASELPEALSRELAGRRGLPG